MISILHLIAAGFYLTLLITARRPEENPTQPTPKSGLGFIGGIYNTTQQGRVVF